jgi:type IV pilus assembly protein PilY1
MKTSMNSRLLSLGAALLVTLAGGPAAADDTEIFTGTPSSVSAARPNILFIFDTSGSMDSNVVTQVPYSPATTYSGSCRSDRVYYRTGSDANNPPSCSTSSYIPLSAFKCNAGTVSMGSVGYFLAERAARWRSSKWQALSSGASDYVECRADAGVHGDGVNLTKLWAADGNNIGPWTSNPAQAIGWNQNNADRAYTFFSANYLNWSNGGGTITRTRLQIVQEVATQTIDQLALSNNVNVGLMRYSSNTGGGCGSTISAEGGMVVAAMDTVASNATAMKNAITSFNASGCTPLSETMFEAYRYLSGGAVKYGRYSKTSPGSSGYTPSVAASRQASPDDWTYKSPLLDSCQRNFIVLLTDGLPTADNSADADIQALIGGSCAGSGDGKCLEEIARYMYENDLRPTTPGNQNVTTYTIGFGSDIADGTALLTNTANGAGGTYYTAGDTAQLTVVLTDIVRNILSINTTFTAPAVSVNAFNRTQNLNDLFITVFKPKTTWDWPGNIKKYRLAADGTIMDAAGAPAVDINTGFFRSTARSYWSDVVDGDAVSLGGAASQLPAPVDRKLYSNIGTSSALTATENAVVASNAAILDTMLGLNSGDPFRTSLIQWLRGADIDDTNGDGSTTDPRYEMGDPMHGRPATVIYGGTAADPDPNDGVIYAVTNAGYLHAIDIVDGSERWAFVPRQLMRWAADQYRDAAVTQRTYGFDGNVRVYKHDVNGNGIVEPLLGDKVYVFAGMRRGGQEYYGFDVTDRDSPTLLWKIGPNETGSKQLPGAGQSWSTPTLARVTVSGQTQNSMKLVLVIGGGYDSVQDNGPYATDTVGNRIFMVDAVSGNLLWYAGPSSDANADLKLASMTHSIPADVRVLDLTGDGFADRMYVGDMGGRVWRFDIASGATKDALVTGGVFASLGNAHLTTHPDSSTRRFYNAPDVAFLGSSGRSWLNIALGSGYRGHPLNLATQDRFYSLRDYAPYARLTQAQFNAATPITEADTGLIDVSSEVTPVIPPGAKGWRLDLRQSGSWTGEKSLAEARTFQNLIQFATYEPNNDSTQLSNACSPQLGTNRLYTVSAYNGAPVFNRDSPEDPPDSTDDRSEQLAQGGIAPEVVWLFPSPDNPESCTGAECRPPPVCLIGLENCGVGINLAPVRTFWRQTGVN